MAIHSNQRYIKSILNTGVDSCTMAFSRINQGQQSRSRQAPWTQVAWMLTENKAVNQQTCRSTQRDGTWRSKKTSRFHPNLAVQYWNFRRYIFLYRGKASERVFNVSPKGWKPLNSKIIPFDTKFWNQQKGANICARRHLHAGADADRWAAEGLGRSAEDGDSAEGCASAVPQSFWGPNGPKGFQPGEAPAIFWSHFDPCVEMMIILLSWDVMALKFFWFIISHISNHNVQKSWYFNLVIV